MDGKIEETGIRELTEEELVSAVVEKHRQSLDQDRKEFEELDRKLSQAEEDIKNTKSSRIRMAERKEVLKEKRQQFYHQVEALLEKEFFLKLDHISANKLKEDLKKLKSQISPEEEQNLKGIFMGNLREASNISGLEENILIQIETRLQEARNSNLELKEIIESEKQLEEDDGSKSEIISKSKSQHKWLSSKIKTHEEALNYWEKLKV
ncbi:MAG TPA: hypothetical protein VN278_02915 [Methanosarcina sp.]|nr:hypothetical protein [Methanosarcina sp.]